MPTKPVTETHRCDACAGTYQSHGTYYEDHKGGTDFDGDSGVRTCRCGAEGCESCVGPCDRHRCPNIVCPACAVRDPEDPAMAACCSAECLSRYGKP